MPRSSRVVLTDEQRRALGKWGRGGSTPYRLVVRSKIVLLAAEGCSNREISRRLRVNPITVARWRSRFRLLGLEGIRHEAPRLGSPRPVSEILVRTILHKSLFEVPPDARHWSTRSLAREVGVSHSTVRRIWKAHDVRPPRSRIASISRVPRVGPRSVDLVGVYVNPPQRAVAISLREPAGRGPAGLPRLSPPVTAPNASGGKRWVTDLATTLNLLDQPKLQGSAPRHLNREFLSFLHSVQERRQGREQLHLLAESSDPNVTSPISRWLRRHPEVSARVQVRDAPLRQMVVEWVGDMSTHGSSAAPPRSLPGLQTAVERWAREAADQPRPFAWTRK
jgi:transposase